MIRMFEQLLGSKTRFKLLQVFIHHPDVYYYVRQLTRILNTQINSVRRELMNLEQIGLISSFDHIPEEQGGVPSQHKGSTPVVQSQKKYYKVNTDFFLYPELKALFVKEQIMSEKDLVKSLKKIGTINYLVLTGIFVGLDGEIPTDMVIVGKVESDKLAKLIAEYEKAFNKEINYSVFSLNEYKYRININDRFLHNILSNKKIVAIDELNDETDDTTHKKSVPYSMVDNYHG